MDRLDKSSAALVPSRLALRSDVRGMVHWWMPYAVAGATAIALLLIYWPTAYSIYVIWERSGTFAHGFVVIPITLWLIWRDRETLHTIPARPLILAVAAVAAAGFAWLVAQISTVPSASQFALLFMVQLSVVAILGLPITRRLVFPLAFLFFAVPFGEFLMPWLIERTADATVALLKLSQVPVYREGDHFQIPSGSWSVVEACSGLRYLVASLMAGTLFAYLRYRSFKRRLMFVAASIAVPLVANWLRAYGIVLLGHLSNNRFGAGLDHLIYGWVFFGFVMALLFWIGSFWEEPAPAAPSGSSPNAFASKTPAAGARWIVITGLLCVLVSAVWPPLLRHLEAGASASSPVLRPAEAANGWSVATEQITNWRPSFSPAAELVQQFTKNGRSVGVYIVYYRNQSGSSRLVSTENTLVLSNDPNWKMVRRSDEVQTMPPTPMRVRAAWVIGQGQRLAVREWFWVDGRYTGSLPVAAALVLGAKLAGRGDDSAAVITYTPLTDGQSASDVILDSFASDMLPSLSRALETARLER